MKCILMILVLGCCACATRATPENESDIIWLVNNSETVFICKSALTGWHIIADHKNGSARCHGRILSEQIGCVKRKVKILGSMGED